MRKITDLSKDRSKIKFDLLQLTSFKIKLPKRLNVCLCLIATPNLVRVVQLSSIGFSLDVFELETLGVNRLESKRAPPNSNKNTNPSILEMLASVSIAQRFRLYNLQENKC